MANNFGSKFNDKSGSNSTVTGNSRNANNYSDYVSGDNARNASGSRNTVRDIGTTSSNNNSSTRDSSTNSTRCTTGGSSFRDTTQDRSSNRNR
jgi:hypothetical protein